MPTTAEKLLEAKELVRKGWTRGRYARDKNGKSVPPEYGTACRFCMAGALRKVGLEIFWKEEQRLFELDNIPVYNDDPRTTKKQVLARFDLAIANLSKPATK